ncbi:MULTISPECIES: hypothetical protein [Burkholderia]|uniref:Uncharacterized protein n=1 Tax=Burkholderia pyrrocinia TaxID=60550 RepID=A0A318IR55_BURPY|nr:MULTISPECIES: hypothetical protein [Burkholderia]PXX37654.1 hypothetical protein NA66_1004302 [Burkholderia pyrrocinia]SFW35782.1 hypothetical protein SAMN03159384_01493 [Burkholderia sp. NFACC33-1]SFX90744.1 hypothetical protein SAMN03159408_02570 [Burkholderia sp. NFPP32]
MKREQWEETNDSSDEFYSNEVLAGGLWTRIEMEQIRAGDWFRYDVPRDHEFFGLMFQAADDAFSDRTGVHVKAAKVEPDRSRIRTGKASDRSCVQV